MAAAAAAAAAAAEDIIEQIAEVKKLHFNGAQT